MQLAYSSRILTFEREKPSKWLVIKDKSSLFIKHFKEMLKHYIILTAEEDTSHVFRFEEWMEECIASDCLMVTY